MTRDLHVIEIFTYSRINCTYAWIAIVLHILFYIAHYALLNKLSAEFKFALANFNLSTCQQHHFAIFILYLHTYFRHIRLLTILISSQFKTN